jgi:hypothetical protein
MSTDLTLHQRPVATVFDLLGDKENDITYSVGWGLAQSDTLAYAMLKDVAKEQGLGSPGSLVAVRLQEHVKGSGYTDIEIVAERLHLIVEAKRGWSLPSRQQLTKYAKSLKPDREGLLLVVAEGSRNFAAGKYPTTIKHPRQRATSVSYRSWADVMRLAGRVATKVRSHNEKRLLRELQRYLKGLMSGRDIRDNMVYVVSLGKGPTSWSPISPRDIVIKHRRYFHEVGGSSRGWPREPYNYLGFRFDGRLQQINHVERVEVSQRPQDHVKGFSTGYEFDRPHYIYYLGPPIKPDHEVKSGRVTRSLRVEAALDLLLTCKTISDARDKTKRRLAAAGA